MKVARQLSPRRHHLATRLFSEGLLNGDEEEKFNHSSKSETDLALEILAVLRNQSQGSFDKFCNVLLDVKDDALRDVEKLLRPHRCNRSEGKHLPNY